MLTQGEQPMKRYDIHTPIRFPVGMYRLSSEEHFNYQLCRTVNWNGGDLNEIRSVSSQIQNFADWKRVLRQLGEKAEKELGASSFPATRLFLLSFSFTGANTSSIMSSTGK